MAGPSSRTRVSRRVFLGGTFVVSAGALIAACASGPTPTPTTAPSKPAQQAPTAAAGAKPTAAAQPTPAATAKPASKAPTEVRFATDWVEGARGETIKAALPEFEKQNPDIKVKLEPIGGDYFDRLQVQFAGGTVADVILFEGVLGAEYIKEGLIADLTDTLRAQNTDQTKWRPGAPEIFKQGGKVYAIPFQLTPAVWFYNKTLFNKMGAPEPDGTWNWDKTLEVAKQLTKPPESYGIWMTVDMFHRYGAMGLQNSDHHWVTPDFKKTLFGEPGFADAIKWTIETVQVHKVAPPPAEVEGLLTAGISNLFATGKVGMAPGNAGGVGSYLRNIGDRFEWDLMPTPKAPLTHRGGGMWNDQPHVVTSNAQKRGVLEQATRLVTFLSSDDVQQIIARDRGSCPTTKAIQESDDYMKPPPASMKVVVDELQEQKGPLFFPNFLEWFNTVNKEYELGLIGERSVDETIKAMVTEGDKVLAKIQS